MMYNIWTLKESEDYEKQYDYAISPDYVDSLWIYQGYPLKDDEEDKKWETPIFTIQYGEFPDFMSNDCHWLLYSEQLKECICKNINNIEVLWLPIKVSNGEMFCIYYAPLIEKVETYENIVNNQMSRKLKNGDIYLPVFVYDSVKNNDLFVLENDGLHIFISDRLKKILESERFKGLEFEQWKAL